ncbi:hypothetical protein EYF80_056767 [Liparis tanakae]|uniref:Uncharacterized protein n=1 Tax=Liparis tanakae TaxID=230148 RepID=A0A4Z2EW92_9TELE|nr:hypothetical protein EYF80_056767 [Liparis tanakae]
MAQLIREKGRGNEGGIAGRQRYEEIITGTQESLLRCFKEKRKKKEKEKKKEKKNKEKEKKKKEKRKKNKEKKRGRRRKRRGRRRGSRGKEEVEEEVSSSVEKEVSLSEEEGGPHSWILETPGPARLVSESLAQ